MRQLRTGTPQPEEDWGVDDLMNHLGYDKPTAVTIMDSCRKRHNLKGYGSIEKHLILDFINEKQREEREREARHQSDIANAEIASALKEQVKTLESQTRAVESQNVTLHQMSASSSADASKARFQSLIANIIAFASLALAVVAMVLTIYKN